MKIRDAQFGHTTDAQDKEHDEALLKAQLSLLAKVAGETESNRARRFAEAYALITGKLESASNDAAKS